MNLGRLKTRYTLTTLFAFLLLLIYRLVPSQTMCTLLLQSSHEFAVSNQNLPTAENNMTILFWTKVFIRKIIEQFITCGNIQCQVTSNRDLFNSSQAVVFHAWKNDLIKSSTDENGVKTFSENVPNFRFQNQYWILYSMEPPVFFTKKLQSFACLFNWTMTFRSDSDIQLTYGRFQQINANERTRVPNKYLAERKKLVAVVLSNCKRMPSERIRLIGELQKYIDIDIYGTCGLYNCSNTNPNNCKKELGKQYKFYLFFENSICQDHLTEKVFQAYRSDMVPIVYGGGNYDRLVPPGSYINANAYPTAKSPADYLLFLNAADDRYLKYFGWKMFYELNPAKIDYKGGYSTICRKLASDFPKGVKSIIHNITDFMLNLPGGMPRCWNPKLWQ